MAAKRKAKAKTERKAGGTGIRKSPGSRKQVAERSAKKKAGVRKTDKKAASKKAANGRRKKVPNGRKKAANGRKKTANGRRKKVPGASKKTANGRRKKVPNGRKKAANGRKKAANGRKKAANGRKKAANGRRKKTAAQHGVPAVGTDEFENLVPAGELAPSGAVATAEDRLGEPPPATLSRGHAALIGAIYRSMYMMDTLTREELVARGWLDDDRVRELDAAAERAMARIMEESPP